MLREDAIEVRGSVVEVLSSSVYRVELANGHRILAITNGKVRLNFVRIAHGDIVTVQLSPYDLSKGTIILRNQEDTKS